MIAFCGLICDTCPIHLATLEPDKILQKEMRASIALQCNSQYGMTLQPEEVNDCDGCKAESGVLFAGCTGCPIRNCAAVRNNETCARCSDFKCETLEAHFENNPECRVRLEELRRQNNNFLIT